jgi:hypothetical protein
MTELDIIIEEIQQAHDLLEDAEEGLEALSRPRPEVEARVKAARVVLQVLLDELSAIVPAVDNDAVVNDANLPGSEPVG